MLNNELRRSFMVEGYEVSPYEKWAGAQGVPIIEDYSVYDLHTVEVAPWSWLGGLGALVHLHGTNGTNNAYVAEIPAGSELKPQRHLYEMFVYVLSGRGATSVWTDEEHKHQFEWQRGSLFAIPLNASYQLFNTSGAEAARLYVVTTLPLMLDLLHNEDFIFQNPWNFTDRFNSSDMDYFTRQGTALPGRVWETNFVPDVFRAELQDWSVRGGGGRNIFFEIADSTMCASISEFEVGKYKKGHRHGPGAHVIVLEGQGYSLMWRDGQEFVKVPWKAGSVFVPPDMWFHQHFNTGPEPARYMPIRWGSSKYHMFNYLGITKDVKEGGDQIEYEDEDPRVRLMFEEELAKNGIPSRMPERPAQ